MDKGGGGVSRFSFENNFSHSAEEFRRGIFYCFINFKSRKMLGIKERGASTSSAEDFLSHSAEYFVGQPFCAVFQNFSGAKKFRERKGEYQDYPSNNFSLTVPKNFVGQTC